MPIVNKALFDFVRDKHEIMGNFTAYWFIFIFPKKIATFSLKQRRISTHRESLNCATDISLTEKSSIIDTRDLASSRMKNNL